MFQLQRLLNQILRIETPEPETETETFETIIAPIREVQSKLAGYIKQKSGDICRLKDEIEEIENEIKHDESEVAASETALANIKKLIGGTDV